MFSGLTRRRRKSSSSCTGGAATLSSDNEFGVDVSSSRLVVFTESDNRKLLYDSKSAETAINAGNSLLSTQLRPQNDTKLLCEMIFGSMNMVYHGCTVKVHPNVGGNVGTVQQTMISYLSQLNLEALKKEERRSEGQKAVPRTMSFTNGSDSRASASPTRSELRRRLTELPKLLSGIEVEGLGLDSDSFSSASASEEEPEDEDSTKGSKEYRKLFVRPSSSPQLGSSLPNSAWRSSSSSVSSVTSSVSSVSKQLWQTAVPAFYSNTHDVEMPANAGGARRSRLKLGIAIILPCQTAGALATSQFIQSHITILESYLERLKRSIELALLEKSTLISSIHEALHSFRERLNALVSNARPVKPLWNQLLISKSEVSTLANSYFSRLSQLNSKQIRFVSQLVTCILTHHLAWVNSVVNSGVEAAKPKVNLRWTQLCDTFGIASSPARAVKIVLISKSSSSADKLMMLVSYFIRSGSISKRYFAVPPLIVKTAASIETELLQLTSLTNSCDANSLDASGGFLTVTVVKPSSEKACDESDQIGSSVPMTTLEGHQSNPGNRELFQSSVATEGGGSGSSASTVRPENLSKPSSAAIGNRKRSSGSDMYLKQSLSPEFSDFRVHHDNYDRRPPSSRPPADVPAESSSLLTSSVQEWIEQAEYAMECEPTDSQELEDIASRPLSPLDHISVSIANSSSSGVKSGSHDTAPSLEANRKEILGFSHASADRDSAVELGSSTSFDICDTDSEDSSELDVLSRYIKVPLADHQDLCAPSTVPCGTPLNSIPHSLLGLASTSDQSASLNSDGALQGCLANNALKLTPSVLEESSARFIVDSPPLIIVADLDRMEVSLVDRGVEIEKITKSSPPSKSVEGFLQKSALLFKQGLTAPCCFNVIERSLASLVSRSLALSEKLLSDDTRFLEKLSFTKSELKLMKAVAGSVRDMNNQD